MTRQLAIVLLTCSRERVDPRHDYARRTLLRAQNMIVHDGPVRIHIADDGSPADNRDDLVQLAQTSGWPVSVTNAEGRGYGASYNLATQAIHSELTSEDLVLPLEDDWLLTRPLETAIYTAPLDEGWAGCVRLGYLGFTADLRGTIRIAAGQYYLLFDPESPEPHVWAGHPRLETAAWQRSVGPWPEGLDAGSTEWEVAHRPEARRGVVWPLSVAPAGDLAAHIGTAQARQDQRVAIS